MILKFKSGDSWVMFSEIDHIEYRRDPGAAIDADIICYTGPDDGVPHGLNELSFFTKNMDEATVIHAYSPIYLMNDQGRTVETI